MRKDGLSGHVFEKMKRAESKAFPETNRTFRERIELSKEKRKEIRKYARMEKLAKEILLRHNIEIEDIFCPSEKDEKLITGLCDPHGYDPVIIAGLCQDIEEELRQSSQSQQL